MRRQLRLDFHVLVIVYLWCPKKNRDSRGANAREVSVAVQCRFCSQHRQCREQGAGRRLTQQPSGKQTDQSKAHWQEKSLDYMVLVTCSSRGGVGGRLSIRKQLPRGLTLARTVKKTGVIQTLLTWTFHAVLCCSHHQDVSGALLSFLWCGCPRLDASHRCSTAKHSSQISSLFV